MEDGFSRGDLDAIDDVVPPDFVEHEAGPGQGGGRDGLKAIIAMLRTAFPDLEALGQVDRLGLLERLGAIPAPPP